MDGRARNVVPLHPHGIFPDDADAIQMVMQVHCGGDEVPIIAMEVTDEALDSIRRRMSSEDGVEFTEASGWRFPVMQWRFKPSDGQRLVLTVVDQGRRRVFRHSIERR